MQILWTQLKIRKPKKNKTSKTMKSKTFTKSFRYKGLTYFILLNSLLSLLMLISVMTISIIIDSNPISAYPVLPMELYGRIVFYNSNATAGVVRAYVNGVLCGTFNMVNNTYYGLLSCIGDDPETERIEGGVPGANIRLTYNNYEGDETPNSTWISGNFENIDLYIPVLVCGDGFCDMRESCATCPTDCGTCPSGGTGSGGGGTGARGNRGTIITRTYNMPAYYCEELWDCSPWSRCMPDGFMYRKCIDLNNCGTTFNKPLEKQPCEYEGTCFDGVKNCHDGSCEEGIDCGGPCPTCASCFDKIKNCHDGSCEEGIDCGGPCPACPSCNDSIQNCHDGSCEEGIDCGGPCPACKKKASLLEHPLITCDRSINWHSSGLWFYILSILTAIAIRTGFGLHRYRYWHERKDLAAVERMKKALSERRRTYMFAVTLSVISIIIAIYYYFFGLCPPYNLKLWWLLIIMLGLSPFIIHRIMKIFEYDELKKILALEKVLNTHYRHVAKLLELQDNELAEREERILKIMESINKEYNYISNQYPEIKHIYKDLTRLYDRYKQHKSGYKLERSLLEQIAKLKDDANFKKIAQQYNKIEKLRNALEDLYKQYEERQLLYDELSDIEQELLEKVSGRKIKQAAKK